MGMVNRIDAVASRLNRAIRMGPTCTTQHTLPRMHCTSSSRLTASAAASQALTCTMRCWRRPLKARRVMCRSIRVSRVRGFEAIGSAFATTSSITTRPPRVEATAALRLLDRGHSSRRMLDGRIALSPHRARRRLCGRRPTARLGRPFTPRTVLCALGWRASTRAASRVIPTTSSAIASGTASRCSTTNRTDSSMICFPTCRLSARRQLLAALMASQEQRMLRSMRICPESRRISDRRARQMWSLLRTGRGVRRVAPNRLSLLPIRPALGSVIRPPTRSSSARRPTRDGSQRASLRCARTWNGRTLPSCMRRLTIQRRRIGAVTRRIDSYPPSRHPAAKSYCRLRCRRTLAG